MTQALVSILNVTLSKNPVFAGEKFIIAVEVFAYHPESAKRRLPSKLGPRKEIR